ncbi:MAG TPA: thiamine-phosphate kinase [Terriglobales bacterium]|nr:thiamine-phosphate kinase [Terriglobales bacterium]
MPLPEAAFLTRLRRSAGKHSAAVLGIGDDCAIMRVPAGHEALVTTDLSLEGVHFRRDWQRPEDIGHRCLLRGLSDIAAMGGRPIAAFLSIGLPSDLPQAWFDSFIRGLLQLARKYHVHLAGGDTSASPAGILADIVVVGSVPRDTALQRSGARPGNRIYVTGELGAAAAILGQLRHGLRPTTRIKQEPRIAIGDWLRRKGIASAAIDLSDGLSTDLSHICAESAVGAVLSAAAIPIHPLARDFHNLDLALHGGEDYELLFTAPASRRVPRKIAGVKITHIGEIIRGKTMKLEIGGKRKTLEAQGWEHFSVWSSTMGE